MFILGEVEEGGGEKWEMLKLYQIQIKTLGNSHPPHPPQPLCPIALPGGWWGFYKEMTC